MSNYAVVEDATIINVIVADSKVIAEELTGKECIGYTDGELGLGWYWYEPVGKYIEPAPYESWTFNVTDEMWEAPVEMPVEDGKMFTWDEATLSWVSHDTPSGE